ncbi:MAG TPA: TonB-dependent receptor [Gracilimonas sp.]|uniref:TonB-dependent receptor n=1 Tax=Gracilimonas sp. TaxID=1974203 RepID=UPI002DB51E5A|nr:TonB-dependent receptor [Gracilimonas sp.]
MTKQILPILFLVCSFSINAFAQKGTLRGTIIDDETAETIFGATIYIQSMGTGTTSDFDGKFELELAPGEYTLRISYISYQTIDIENVEIEEGEVTNLGNIRLHPAISELEGVVVTSQRVTISEAAIMTAKMNSPNLIDGISAEAFSKTGVSDAAEALKKVTGVSVEDGKYVYVRGLGDRYTQTMLNSVQIPSLDPDRNSLQIDIFPTNLINNMVITKTAVAEMPANFTGGIVNIETIDFPQKPIYDFSISFDYNPDMHFNSNFLTYDGSNTDFLGFDNGARELPSGAGNSDIPSPISGSSSEEVFNFVNSFNPTLGPYSSTNFANYSASLTLGNQYNVFSDNKLGYIMSLTYKSSSNHYNNYQLGEYQNQPDPSAYDLIYATRQNGTLSEQSVLLGGLAGLAFKTENSKYKFTALHLQNGESTAGNFFIDNSVSAPGQSGYTADSYNLEYGQRSITNFLLNGINYFDDTNWEVNWRASATFSSMTDPDIRKTAYTLSLTGTNPRFNAGAGGFPSRIWRYMDEVNYANRLDITREYDLFDLPAKLKFGGSYVYKERDFEILSFNLQFFGSQPVFEGDPSEILVEENLYGGGGNIYYQSGNPDPNPNAYNSNVNSYAGYVSNEFSPFERLKVYVGLRAEQYTQRHTGRDALFAQGGSGNNLDNEKVLDGLDLFPSANLSFEVGNDQNLRLAYSRTIARPSFKELSFAQILDPVSDRIFNGGLFKIGDWDGNLTETYINNYDFRWEKYMGLNEMISASLFYKTFQDPIELVRIQVQVTSSEFQPRNVGDGQVYGAEFEVRKSLGFISESIRNFGITTNVTLVRSEIDMTEQEYRARKNSEKDGQNVDDTRNMAGQSPYVINAGFTYDNLDKGLDAGFFYNVKGETLTAVGGGLFPDVYSQPYHSLNFNMNKSFGEEGKSTLSFSVTNILDDSRDEFYQGFNTADQIFSSYNEHRSISIGYKYSF